MGIEHFNTTNSLVFLKFSQFSLEIFLFTTNLSLILSSENVNSVHFCWFSYCCYVADNFQRLFLPVFAVTLVNVFHLNCGFCVDM